MNIIIRQAKIVAPTSDYHGSITDIKITDGRIDAMTPGIENVDDYQEISAKNLHVSQGWFDASVSFGEPGFEERETIISGSKAAAVGGFTAVAVQPNCSPATDGSAQVAYLKSRSQNQPVDLYPIGTLTKNAEGKDLSELFDMKNAGAIAFGDYNKHIRNANLLKIGLQYAVDFDGLIIAYSQDPDIAGAGVANEGEASTRLGMKGIPSLAEELAVARNLQILEYTGGKMLIPTISASGSVRLIREAKAKGLRVFSSVSAHHLALSDQLLENFDSRFKTTPPLRSEEERQLLVEAVIDGTIDLITSDHNPIDVENKNLEFDQAKPGTIGLESCFGALGKVLPMDTIIEKLTFGKNIFGLPSDPIAIGQPANLTLFDPEFDYVFSREHIFSRSQNAAFLGMPLRGKALGICNNGNLHLST